jgi:DNA-binding PadR family transcriptional regulator
MTYGAFVNFVKTNEWKLSMIQMVVMTVFADLESWADETVHDDGDTVQTYYVLYIGKIISDLPFIGSKSSVSRAINDLESKGIIKRINKHSYPAYRLTEKGMTWKKHVTETCRHEDPQHPEETHQKSKNKFSLGKKIKAHNLSNDYYSRLHNEAKNICNAQGIPFEEFSKFFDYHSSRGNGFVNWLAAFRNWTRNYKQYNPNGGEKEMGLLG